VAAALAAGAGGDDLRRAARWRKCAQPAPKISDDDMTRARQRHPMPTDAELSRVPVPSAPRIESLPRPATSAPIDLEALAKGFDAQRGMPVLGDGPRLLVFISFSMPDATLERLVDQAARAGATLVLRGLVNGSLRDTVERMQHLIGNRKISVQIDPQAFDRFSVARTPSFVLVRAGASAQACGSNTCIGSDQYLLAAGDVSLDYALAQFQRSTPRMAGDASRFLQRMKGSQQ
jgi:conjugal transfer pilus assembly protein TrbC